MLHILHVDDSRDDFELAKAQLERRERDISIDWADSGELALTKVAEQEYDCILCDFQMPGKDGLELLTNLRKADFTIPFIFLTGQGNERIASEAFRSGADDYYTKDVGFAHYDRLMNSIKRVVDAHKRRFREEQATQALKKSEEDYHYLFSGMIEGFAFHEIILDDDGKPVDYRFLNVNPAFERLTGLKAEDVAGRRVLELIPNLEPIWIERYGHVALAGEPCRFEDYNQNIGKYFEVHAFSPRKGQFACNLRDITKQKLFLEKIQRNEARLRSVISVLQYKADTTSQFLDHALDEAIRLTGSKIGYIYHYYEERKEFVLHAWSKTAMKECSIAEPQTCYELNKTGIWGEAVRQRKPIILNDFQAEHSLKKGYPEGHAELYKYLTVPIFSDGRVIAVAGVANKETDYDETDALQLSLLMETVFNVVDRKHAEEIHLRSEEKYRILFENAYEAIFVAREGKIVFNNPMTTDMIGCSDEELTSTPFTEFIHPDDREMVTDRHIRRMKGEDVPQSYTFRIVHKDGTIKWVELNTVMITWAGANATINFLKDITAQMFTEAALRESEAMHRSLFEGMLNGYAFCRMLYEDGKPCDFIYLSVNSAFEEQTGLKNVVGKRVTEVIPGIREADQELFEICGRVATTGNPEYFEIFLDSLKMWFSISVYSPKKEHFVAVFDVITERKKAEQFLKDSEEKYRNLFETMEQAVVYQGADGKVISANPAAERILGVALDEMTGRTSHDSRWEAIHEDGSPFPGDEHPAMVALRTGEPVDGVIMGIRHHESGARRWIYISATPQFLPGEDKPYQVFAAFSDITARKHYEEELKRYADQLENRTRELTAANQELETFSYSVSHDLRKPLRHIDGYIQIIQQEHAESLNKSAAGYFDRVRNSVSIMNQLIDGLLVLSRVTSAELAQTEVDLSAQARKVADSLSSESPDRKAEFRIADGLKATADPRLMHLVLENLIGNAWKFTQERDHTLIEFGCEKDGKETIYYIRDNGVGFDPAAAERLFIPFSRLHSESEFGGTGIGLATVKRIINRHGGNIRAAGEPDKGATFYFTLK